MLRNCLYFAAGLVLTIVAHAESTGQPQGSAQNMPPTISDLPSPIIGDLPSSPRRNLFVFADAFDLNQFVSDDFTTKGGIMWSYQIMGDWIYSINGCLPLYANDPVSPPIAKQLQLNQEPFDIDKDPYTVTLRDVSISPNNGNTTFPDPPVIGLVHSQVITLWASDGSTASSKSTIFYTDNDGEDAFHPWNPNSSDCVFDFTTGTNFWTYRQSIAGVMTGTATPGGLCVNSALSDVAIEGWVSPAVDPIELVDHSVYKIRVNLTTSAAIDQTPIMQFVINNTGGDYSNGFAYGGEFLIVDQQGGANAITSRQKGEYVWYYAPPQVQVSNWRNTTSGAFAPQNAGIKDFRMEWNIIDVDGAFHGELRSGTICLNTMCIDRMDFDSLTSGTEIYGIGPGEFNEDNFGYLREYALNSGNLTPSLTGGNIVVAATSATLNLVVMEPGPSPFAADAAHFPIPIVPEQAYMIQWTVGSSAGTNPIEIMAFYADTPTNEIIQSGYSAVTALNLGAAALPTMGGPEEVYTHFYYTHSQTAVEFNQRNWRPKLALANRKDVNEDLAADNTLTFSRVSVVPVD